MIQRIVWLPLLILMDILLALKIEVNDPQQMTLLLGHSAKPLSSLI
jgi:hypothetical protein